MGPDHPGKGIGDPWAKAGGDAHGGRGRSLLERMTTAEDAKDAVDGERSSYYSGILFPSRNFAFLALFLCVLTVLCGVHCVLTSFVLEI